MITVHRFRRAALVAVGVAVLATSSAAAVVDPPSPVSGLSPFAAGCNGAPQSGTEYRNSEVEPWVDVNPADQENIVGAWQQDRWSNGGSNGLLSAFSTDGGQSWTTPPVSPTSDTGQAKFTRCSGGTAANGGDYERGTDPWVSFSPNGVAQQIALSFNDSNVDNAVLASRSIDKGANWSDPVTIRRDNNATIFNDKESLTADPTNSDFVYATWQRLVYPNEQASSRAAERGAAYRSVAWFARSTDNGVSYEPARPVYDPGNKSQTIGNQIVVLPNGDLVMVFNLIRGTGTSKSRGYTAAVIRSTDKGATWSAPIAIDRMFTDGVTDPADGHAVRTGDILPQIAVDENSGALYVVWQDDRFTGQEQIAMAKSTDGGISWLPTQRISTVGGINQAFTPTVRVANDGTVADDGTVAVTHYDFRDDVPSVSPPLTTDTWILRSQNGGASFTEEKIGTPFDMATAPDARGYFVGDYEGLDFAASFLKPGFKAFFVRATGDLTNRTDVVATTATLP